jgi:Tol biopolymer transport system component
VYIDWNNGSLVAYDFATGAKRDVINNGDGSSGWPDTPLVSFDGKWIAYGWSAKAGPMELRIAPMDGGQPPRAVYRPTDGRIVKPIAWFSSDNRLLVAASGKGLPFVVLQVGIADGRSRLVKTLDKATTPANAITRFALSPDNRYVAFDRPQVPNRPERDILLFAVDTGVEVPVVTHAAYDYLLGWSPDGRQMIFASDRTGTIGIWGMAVANGLPTGPATVLRSDAGAMLPNRITPSGSIFYMLSSDRPDVYLTDVDLDAGRELKPPSPVNERTIDNHRLPAWSRDGRTLSCVRGSAVGSTDPVTLVVRPSSGGPERPVGLELNLLGRLLSSPDGRSVIVRASPGLPDDVGWYRIDTESGSARRIFGDDPVAVQNVIDWLPDSQSLLVRRAPIDGTDTPLHRRQPHGVHDARSRRAGRPVELAHARVVGG